MIPGQQQPALLLIPACEGKHAAQPAHRIASMQAERPQHHGGIAARLELLPLAFQAPPQIAVIVDLAVERDDVPGNGIEHRLDAGRRQVEDRKPAVRQQRAPAAIIRRRGPYTMGIRAAMEHGVVHPLQRSTVGRINASNDSGDATHENYSLEDGMLLRGSLRAKKPTADQSVSLHRKHRMNQTSQNAHDAFSARQS